MSLIMEILNTHSLVDNHGLLDGMIEVILKNIAVLMAECHVNCNWKQWRQNLDAP